MLNWNSPIRLYVSSKLKHAAELRQLDSRDGIYLTSRWVYTADQPELLTRPAAKWQQDNFDDIARSEALLVYVEFGEHLKGGLVEVGVALAHRIPVWVVGEHSDYSKWQFHPAVRRAASLEAAVGSMKSVLRRSPA